MKSLGSKIELSYLVLVAIIFAVTTFSAYHFTQLGSSIRQILQRNYRSVLAAENMVKALERQEHAQLAMQVEDRDEARASFVHEQDAFFHWFEEAVVGIALPQEPALLDSISVSYRAYLIASDSLYDLAQADRFEAYRSYQDRVVRPLVEELRRFNFELLEVNQAAMLETQMRVERAADRATKTVIGASLLAVLLSVLASIRFAREIVRPITHLTTSVRQIGRGVRTEPITVTTKDEIAVLGHEFNRMTERLRAFEALNVQQLIAEKQKSESLVATMPSPVIVTDEEGGLLLLNRAATALLQVRDDAWQHRPLREVVQDARLVALLEGAPADPAAVETITTAGAAHHYRLRQRHIRDEAGHVTLTVTLLEDVTHFKELDQLKSDFLAAVSHELRTPLTSLGMALDLLLETVPGPLTELQEELLVAAREDNERLKKLVKSLLDLARLEAGEYRLPQTPVALEEVVQGALSPLRLPFLQKDVSLDVSLSPHLPVVTGDGEQLGWVVTNLAGNALRHTPSGGRVQITARAAGGAVHVCVADTGAGIPPEALERIFDRFVQVKGTNLPGSVGLGLAIARKVIEAHGGRIWAESTPGAGSTFHFTLPAPDVPSGPHDAGLTSTPHA